MSNGKIAVLNVYRNVEGAEVYLERLVSKLPEQLYERTVVFSPVEMKIDRPWKKIMGIDRQVKIGNLFNFFLMIPEINSLLRKECVEIILLNGERSMYLAPFMPSSIKKIGIKHMLIIPPLVFIKNLLHFFVFKKMNSVVTISKLHVRHLTKITGIGEGGKIRLIYNSVDEKKFVSTTAVSQRKEFVFLEVASLIRRKGQLDLLKAFHLIHRRYENARLIFAGDGELYDDIEKQIADYALEDKVHLYGHVENTAKLINNCDVVVLPSYREGLPLCLLEAMSCSRPVIAGDVAAVSEAVRDGENGFLIQPGDVNALAQKMSWCLENRDSIKRMGENGRNTIEKTFCEAEFIKKWAELLDE